MRPRTKLQYRVAQLSSTLPSISEIQELWAMNHIFEKVGYKCKGFVWCSECGRIFPYKDNSDLGVILLGSSTICPCCGSKLKVEVSRKTKRTEKIYYQILTVCKEFQVVRNFIAVKYSNKGHEPYYAFREAFQNWITAKGEETIIARPCNPVPHCYDSWDFSKKMEIRNKRHGIYGFDKYSVNSWIYPHSGVHKILRRNGFTTKCDVLPVKDLILLLYKNHEAEVLIKNKQYSLLKVMAHRKYQLPFQSSIKIAIRHKYIVKDASMWLDYLGFLDYFHLDLHNPKYVCPKNLKKEHDRLSKKKERVEQRLKEEEKRRMAAKYEEDYRKTKEAYFGICFGNEDIMITVISSVAEMAEEGIAMHHCVYHGEYFKKNDSLILSAKDKEGNRLETIELSLTTFKIVQSRAKFNGIHPKHEEIIDLVNKNIHLIKQVA